MRHRIQRIIRKPDIVNPVDQRMIAQEFRYFARVSYVALHGQGERLNPLQEQKSVKWRQRGAGVALTHGPASRDKRSIPVMIDIDDPVIGNLRHVEHVEFFRILSPRKLAAIHNHPTNTGAAPSDEFRHGMYDDIGAVFDRPQQNRRSHGVVYDQRNSMLVRYLGQSFDVRYISRWITDTLAVNRARILVDQLLDIFGTVTRRKARANSPLREDVRQQRVSGAI